MITHYIFYVLDQEKSSRFYESVFDLKPVLEVPGMTEFQLNEYSKLGLMPYAGIEALLGSSLTTPDLACRNPNSELYLVVENPEQYHARSLQNGGIELSGVEDRDWGHAVGYSEDVDGHILAFAKPC